MQALLNPCIEYRRIVCRIIVVLGCQGLRVRREIIQNGAEFLHCLGRSDAFTSYVFLKFELFQERMKYIFTYSGNCKMSNNYCV